jgi:hypothetical protein
MSARTKTTQRKRGGSHPAAMATPFKVIVSRSMEDDFTPETLKHHRQRVSVKSGTENVGVRVFLAEGDWQHNELYLGIYSDWPGTDVTPFEGPIPVGNLDRIIEALTTARGEASRLGLLSFRSLPKASQQ